MGFNPYSQFNGASGIIYETSSSSVTRNELSGVLTATAHCQLTHAGQQQLATHHPNVYSARLCIGRIARSRRVIMGRQYRFRALPHRTFAGSALLSLFTLVFVAPACAQQTPDAVDNQSPTAVQTLAAATPVSTDLAPNPDPTRTMKRLTQPVEPMTRLRCPLHLRRRRTSRRRTRLP